MKLPSAFSRACSRRRHGTSRPRRTSAQPNIIFVMADDLGYTDVASSAASITRRPKSTGSPRRDEAHQLSPPPDCAPTRAALMTANTRRARASTPSAASSVSTGASGRSAGRQGRSPPRPSAHARRDESAATRRGCSASGTSVTRACITGASAHDEAIVSQGAHFVFERCPRTEYRKDNT